MKNLPLIAIVGQTNAGKSSLFNRIVGKPQTIVAREEGTTRDRVIATTSHNDKSFVLVDTAGLKKAEDDFEATIQAQISEVADLADVVIVAVDGTTQSTEEDKQVAKLALKTGKKVVLAVNKGDFKKVKVEDFKNLGIRLAFKVSANHGDGVPELLDEVVSEITQVKKGRSDKLKVAFVGRPNVGKSALFNSLSKKQSAIVADLAGTTRDVNHIDIKYHGREIELLDTAGIRRRGKVKKGPEEFSVLRTMLAIEEADICCLLIDVNEPSTNLDQKIAGQVKDAGKGLIIVVTKWDTLPSLEKEAKEHVVEDRKSDQNNVSEDASEITPMSDEESKDAYTRDRIAKQIQYDYQFAYWAPLIFTSSVTGQNVNKLLDLFTQIEQERTQKIETKLLNQWLQMAVLRQAPAARKTFPKLKYMTQTGTNPPEFTIHGRNTDALHFSYPRYLENSLRDEFGFEGTAIKIRFAKEEPKDPK